MSDYVPDFGMDDEYSNPSELSRPRKSPMGDDEIMELLWQNGQVVMQSQNQRKKSNPPSKIIQDSNSSDEQQQQHLRPSSAAADGLFMHEDEMASWLHYPLDDTSFDRDFCSDFLYQIPSVSIAPTIHVRTAAKPPIPPSNFLHFSRTKGNHESGPSNLNKIVGESTVVDSNDTPAMVHDFPRASQLGKRTCEIDGAAGASGAEMVACDVTVTSSSPGGSGASASAEPAQKPPGEDRKRKAQQAADEAEWYSEDVEFEPCDAKKQANGSSSTKRSRAAEVHNLSERRRRDRINEKMRALQELIPRCNKSDKASMLDEAIEYLKSLQMQVQMMSMGCSMVPMMYPGAQHFMTPMGMGMGLGMDMSMSRPIIQFPSVLSGSAMPTPSAAAHLGPRFPMPAYHMQPVPVPDPSQIQTSQQSDRMINPHANPNLNQIHLPNFVDPYQRYLSLHQMQFPLPQNQTTAQPGTSKPSTQ